MIFRTLLAISLLLTSLTASEYKYRHGFNDDCINHNFEVKESNTTATIFTANLCDYYESSAEPILIISDTITYGKTYYHKSFDKGGLYYGFSGGLGEAIYKTYGNSRTETLFIELDLRGGYEKEVYKGLTLGVSLLAYNQYILSSDNLIDEADKNNNRRKIEEYSSGDNETDLKAFFNIGVEF